MTYEAWLDAVDRRLKLRFHRTADELAELDVPWREHYDAGVSPQKVIEYLLESLFENTEERT